MASPQAVPKVPFGVDHHNESDQKTGLGSKQGMRISPIPAGEVSDVMMRRLTPERIADDP